MSNVLWSIDCDNDDDGDDDRIIDNVIIVSGFCGLDINTTFSMFTCVEFCNETAKYFYVD